MLYEFKLNHSAAEAARNRALAFGTDSPSERKVRCWFAKFSSGNFDLEDKPGRGRRMSLDDQALGAAVEAKPDTTIQLKFLATSVSVFFPRCFRRVVARVYISEFRKYPGTECLHVNVMNMKNHRHMRLLPMMIVHMHGLASTEPATVSYRVRPTTKPIGVLRKCTTTRSRLRTGSTQPWITKG
ncbi:hypothetical protein Y032_0534g3066 [Ancylostoma ceylanicum]|nr:hypothetical protein Y032_0534g3066 [Ancylostoma ceylanicum]